MSNSLSEAEQHDESLSDRIVQQLRNKIITGELAPGARLRERELADELGVSRIPLREAMQQLESDGFIQSAIRRGAIVTELTLRDVEELFNVRLCVEVYATRLAAQRVADGASVSELQAAMRQSERAVATGNVNSIAESNAELHEEIVHLADNSLLTTMMRSVSGRDRWIFRMTNSVSRPAAACQEHVELCDAIYAGNPDFAAAISYSHIERGRKPTIDVLRSVLPLK
ncbi:GntR family transcriptional regulator [Jatrophihabitans sp. GAS493]|uniref:GntR family transcriptional regulator n=1 Tax=Jatrophihabitans sp. GAS493 TaxID=1907575 RepID=UPI000BB6D472|nr:GntR family transcriptional regulator [Jatrophihabitans sp. GAS493]SOD72603.1 GntR family transcriptional regulator [Jatrophihabitans sp. GAS493]